MLIRLYRPETDWLDIDEVTNYLENFGLDAEVREPALPRLEPEAIAETRVRDPFQKFKEFRPLLGEVRYEERMRERPEKIGGILYDAHRLTERLRATIEPGTRDSLSIVFTDRLIGTHGMDRYHARTVYMGHPSIVSTSGTVEAPAKPKDFYRKKTTATGENVPAEIAKQELDADFLEHGDPRVTEVAKGLVLQDAVYRATGEAFCDDADCRLYNAHHQDELLAAQLDGELCDRHEEIVKKL